jgi:hypothetical protein
MKKFAFDQRTMDILKHYAQPVGIGAGLGAAGMGAANMMSDEEEDHHPGSLMKSMLLGAGLGGAGGASVRAGADIMKPDQGSPAGLKASGLPEKLPGSHWGLNLTRPFAGADHGGSNWLSVPSSAGVGAVAQLGANKIGPKPVDMSKVKTPTLDWSGYNTSDPYFQNVVDPAKKTELTGLHTAPPAKGKGGGGATKVDNVAIDKGMSDFYKTEHDAFQKNVGAVNDLKRPNGSLGREGLEQLANKSPRVGFDPSKNWNPALGPIDPANDQAYKMRSALGAGGADVAGKMTSLQKLRASVQNPLAWLAEKTLPESYVYQGARDLDPTHIQPSEMKNHWTSEVYNRGPNQKLNRFAYTPKSTAMQAGMTGKVPSMMGRGKWAVGPAAAAGAYFGGGALHDNAMDQAIAELQQMGGPRAEELLRQMAQRVEQSKSMQHPTVHPQMPPQ